MSNRKASVYVGRLFIIIAALAINSYGLSLPRQNVPKPFCPMAPDPLKPDTSHCFDLITQTITVCKEVTSLGDLYKFCTSIPILNPIITKPARIMLCLDASGSMCQDDANCPGGAMNDPTNKRIIAANALVDSVAKHCPACELGVVHYVGVSSADQAPITVVKSGKLAPLALNQDNVSQIHSAINTAACMSGMMGKVRDVAGLAGPDLTFSGIALDTAIRMVDQNFDSTYDRHVIIMTDGDWQTPVPDVIYIRYATTFPGRLFPTVYGVVISDSARHVAAGYPPQGIYDCVNGAGTPVDVSSLHAATQLSIMNPAPNNKAGLYFPGATPQTIVETFDSLFKVIIITHPITLRAITFTNTTVNPPETKTAMVISNGNTANQLLLTVRVPDFPLQFGINTFIVAISMFDTSMIAKTSYDTLTIIRTSDNAGAINPPGKAATLVKARKGSLSRELFDVRGRLLSNSDMRASANEAIPYKGVYFIKYGDGRVVRRINFSK